MLETLRPVVITVCVGYADYLRATLPHTLQWATAVYVVTDKNDPLPGIEGVAGVEILRTDAFSRGGAVFNKSAAVREAQEIVHAAHPDAWILLLDADIIASPELCHDVTDPSALYSVGRMDYATPADYAAGRGSPYHTPGAGYFQLYFEKSNLYPEHSNDASECDMDFYRTFPRCHIAGGMVSHLGRHTVNWRGRASPRWD